MPTCTTPNILDLVTAITLVITLCFVGIQTWLLRQSNYAIAYKAAYDILQDQEMRVARLYVFENLEQKTYADWTPEDKEIAGRVCQAFDGVGQMVRNKMLPEKYIVDHWAAPLRKIWPILRPLVIETRKKRNYSKNWDDFEYLVNATWKLHRDGGDDVDHP
jgi:cbb3-type cytochrome oxidase subunit 3